jgi:hypothetical protein
VAVAILIAAVSVPLCPFCLLATGQRRPRLGRHGRLVRQARPERDGSPGARDDRDVLASDPLGRAERVSVLVVGRWLSPGYGNTRRFISEHLQSDYDPGVCPVTGGACP